MSAIAGRVLLIPKGNYDSTATYTMLDMVVYNGSSYICKQECTGVVPTNTTYWMLNASGSAVAYINDIGDVVITNVSNGQVLMYDSTTQKWVNGTLTLNGLNDTQFASLSDGQVLKYNATSQKWENAEDTGGLLPHLIVISETGSTVTATKGQTVITATETSTGHYECDVPEFGTWTIHAVLNGDDATVNLNVDTVKVYTIDDSHFHGTVTVKYPSGATCRLQSADETLYATGSPYTFTVHHAETYTITVTYNQRIYTDTVTFTTEGQSFSKTLPSPSEVDANDINLWLFFGGVSGSYSSLSDILADSTALATLMASQDAVDYLVRCKDWIRKASVPIMTSDTTPSGEAFGLTPQSGNPAYKSFDNDNSTFYAEINLSSGSGAYVGYDFKKLVNIKKVDVMYYNLSSTAVAKVQYYNSDNDTWIDASDNFTINANGVLQSFNINTDAKSTKWRLYKVSSTYSGGDRFPICTLQFYTEDKITDNQSAMSYIGLNNYCANTLLADSDWCEGIGNSEYFESVLNVKVPTMTSNTTPSGVCSAINTYSGTAPWYAFDNNDTSYWMSNSQSENAWVQYKFAEKHKIFAAFIKTRLSSGGGTNWRLQDFIIQSSDDDFATHKDEYTGTMPRNTNGELKVPIPNPNEADIWRLHGINTYQDSVSVLTVQFYGREDV